jgi:hypothetical protein
MLEKVRVDVGDDLRWPEPYTCRTIHWGVGATGNWGIEGTHVPPPKEGDSNLR